MQRFWCVVCMAVACFTTFVVTREEVPEGHWPQWGRDSQGSRFSPLTDINKSNVDRLQVAWTYDYTVDGKSGTHEATPIVIDDGSGNGTELLIFCTPWNELIALNPVTGEEVYRKDTVVEEDGAKRGQTKCRGLASWLDEQKADGDLCRRRVFMATGDAMLVAMDAASGTLCAEFGNEGIVDATIPGGTYSPENGTANTFAGFSSAPTVVRDTVVVGIAISDQETSGPPSGQPCGYDCRTGALKWRFYVIPQNESDPAYSTWDNGTAHVGGGNVWAPISGDDDLSLVYLPTSCAHFDYWGGNRKGKNEYTSSVVALDADTGAYRWHYQLVHHDTWNYDTASQPVVAIAKETTKSVLQMTKMGMLFVLDAETGEPVFPVEERNVSSSKMSDDEMWPTQPHVVGGLGQLTAQSFSRDDIYNFSEAHVEACQHLINNVYNFRENISKMFTPFELGHATLHIPGDLGGGNWMSLALHPDKHLAVIPVNNMPTVRQLFRSDEDLAEWCVMGDSTLRGSPYYACQVPFFNLGDERLIPCIKPPWARLVAVDLRDGSVVWTRPYGEALQRLGNMTGTGVRRVIGGAIVTASNLVLATGGTDLRLWAYDLETGEALWRSEEMRYDLTSVPMTYKVGGKQFVTASGGGHWASYGLFDRGGLLYAFSLPDDVTSSTDDITHDVTLSPTDDVTHNVTLSPTDDVTRDVTLSPTDDVTHNVTLSPTDDVTHNVTLSPTDDVTHNVTLSPTDVVTQPPSQPPVVGDRATPTAASVSLILASLLIHVTTKI